MHQKYDGAGTDLWLASRNEASLMDFCRPNTLDSLVGNRRGWSMALSRVILLFLAVALLHSLGNWSLPLIDRDEPRFAEASREMLERGDYVVPYANGKERFDKPPLIYWMQTSAYRVLGINEFAARLPSVLCTALAAVFLALWGARLHPGTSVGLHAACIFALCLQTAAHARAAVADMAMIVCVLGSAWAGWEWLQSQKVSRIWTWSAFWFWTLLGLGFLAKGPIALIPIGMVAWASRPAFRAPRTWGVWLAGCLWMLAIVAAWGIPALIATNGEFASVGLGKHVVARTAIALEGHGSKNLGGYLASLPFYFLTVFASFFPWSLWLPTAVKRYWPARSRGEIERYLVSGVVLTFGIFTLSRTKLPHYTLPAFPFMALLLAMLWHWTLPDRGVRRVHRVAVWAAGMLVALALIGFPLIRPLFPTPALHAKIRPMLTPETALGAIDYNEPSIVWSFRADIRPFMESVKERKAVEWITSPGPRVLILSGEMKTRLFPTLPEGCEEVSVDGINFVKFKPLKVIAIIKR